MVQRIDVPPLALPTLQPPLHVAIQPFLARGRDGGLFLVLRPDKLLVARSNADLGVKVRRQYFACNERRAHVRSPGD